MVDTVIHVLLQMEEEERKAQEYLDKLGAVFHYDCYQENKPEGTNITTLTQRDSLLAFLSHFAACHQYAEYLIVAKKDRSRGLDVFLNVCENMKFSESCLSIGNMYITGNKGRNI